MPSPAKAKTTEEVKPLAATSIKFESPVELRPAMLRELNEQLADKWSKREAASGREVQIVSLITKHYKDKQATNDMRMQDIITELRYMYEDLGWGTKASMKNLTFIPIAALKKLK